MMNINQLMKQAKIMQQKMETMQQEMANLKFEGKSGGGLVTVNITGNGKMDSISIDPSLLQISEKEMLEDLIVAAFSEAKNKADETSGNNLNGALGSLGGLPSGFKLPF